VGQGVIPFLILIGSYRVNTPRLPRINPKQKPYRYVCTILIRVTAVYPKYRFTRSSKTGRIISKFMENAPPVTTVKVPSRRLWGGRITFWDNWPWPNRPPRFWATRAGDRHWKTHVFSGRVPPLWIFIEINSPDKPSLTMYQYK
jgi:hypothetical protein